MVVFVRLVGGYFAQVEAYYGASARGQLGQQEYRLIESDTAGNRSTGRRAMVRSKTVYVETDVDLLRQSRYYLAADILPCSARQSAGRHVGIEKRAYSVIVSYQRCFGVAKVAYRHLCETLQPFRALYMIEAWEYVNPSYALRRSAWASICNMPNDP